MATDVEWDPTGRYVVTGVSWWAHKVRFKDDLKYDIDLMRIDNF